MQKQLKALLASALLMLSAISSAVTIQDANGEFTLDKTPSRVVALEYSFVDALAQVGVSPVGVADDNNKERILKEVRDKIEPWQSVGTRSQPSLEAIASLKPDLIIADAARHPTIFKELQKIAPTVMFNSRHESYRDNLVTAQKIGDLVNKSEEMKARIAKHDEFIANIAKNIHADGQKVVFGVSNEDKFTFQNATAYTPSFLGVLGFTPAQLNNTTKTLVEINLEQLVMEKPEYMFFVHYRDESLVRKWAEQPLWKAIPAVKSNHIYDVDFDLWARARGFEASEIMAKQVEQLMKQK